MPERYALTFLPMLLLVFLSTGTLSFRQAVDVGSSAGSEADGIVSGPLGKRLDAYFSALEVWGYSGVALVAIGSDVVLEKGYGYADRAARRPSSKSSVQTIGSITKSFTAAAILTLDMAGEVSVEDRISFYLDNVPTDKSAITIHHLLTHSAGFPGSIGRSDFEAIEREAYVERAFAEPLLFEPGSSYEYSNVGYSLLGAIIEERTGLTYEDYLRESVLLPAGMAQTGYRIPEWDEQQRTEGYLDGEHWGTILDRPWADDGPYWNLRANGGLHSTAADMFRWGQVVRDGGAVLDSAAHATWLTPYVDEGYGDSHYAYGWAVHDSPYGRIVAHNGGNGIFAADFFWAEEPDLFVYVASNSSLLRAPSLREEILRMALDTTAALPFVPADHYEPSVGDVAKLAGRYPVASDQALRIDVDDIRLLARPLGQAAINLLVGTASAGNLPADSLNVLAHTALEGLLQGRTDAFDSLPAAAGRGQRSATALLAFLSETQSRLGSVGGIDVVGTTATMESMGMEPPIVATTWARVRLQQGDRVLGLLWDGGGMYQGTTIGPPEDLPVFTLVPVGEGRFVIGGAADVAGEVSFETDGQGSCLVGSVGRVCREQGADN